MADQTHEIETQLGALKAKRQRLLNGAEGVKGAPRTQCEANLRSVDDSIRVAEKKLEAARRDAAADENRTLAAEDAAEARAATELDELCALATRADEHAAALAAAVRELHRQITEIRMRNNRGPSGAVVSAGLERCASKHFGATLRLSLGPSPRPKGS